MSTRGREEPLAVLPPAVVAVGVAASSASTSSGFRWLLPSGSVTVKSEPCPSVRFWASMVPWCMSTIILQRFRPMPVPSMCIWREFFPW